MRSVQTLSDASQNGELPPAEVLRSELEAFDALTAVRQALLETLRAHTQEKKAG
jgi:hypothetical protein